MTNYITEIHLHNNGGLRARNGNGRHANYVGAHNPVREKGKRLKSICEKRKRKARPFVYSIKIVHDPLDIGGFAPGTEFSVLDYTRMLICNSFTPGTELTISDMTFYIHENGGNRQLVKRVKVNGNGQE